MSEEQEPQKAGMYLKWDWDVKTAINCLLQVANGHEWRMWEQHETDTRSIVTGRAANAIREALKGTLNEGQS